MIVVGLVPDSLALRLDTADRAEHCYRAVQDTQRALDLGGKINVPGCVNQIDLVVAPKGGDGRTLDGNTALLLLFHPVHDGIAIVHFAYLVCLSRIKQDTFTGCRFAGIDMRHDTDIAHSSKVHNLLRCATVHKK